MKALHYTMILISLAMAAAFVTTGQYAGVLLATIAAVSNGLAARNYVA